MVRASARRADAKVEKLGRRSSVADVGNAAPETRVAMNGVALWIMGLAHCDNRLTLAFDTLTPLQTIDCQGRPRGW